jgi:hypothetical protein
MRHIGEKFSYFSLSDDYTILKWDPNSLEVCNKYSSPKNSQIWRDLEQILIFFRGQGVCRTYWQFHLVMGHLYCNRRQEK